MDIAIKGKYALYYDSEFVFHIIKDPLLVIEGNRIVSLDTFDKAKRDLASHDMIGDEHQLILPGFINCHTHTPMTLFRGLADDIPLLEWLEQHIWPLEAKLKPEDVYNGALLGVVESLLSGVTTFNSMYWHPTQEILAIKISGIRGMVGAPIISGISSLEKAFETVKKHHHTNNDLIRVNVAPHAPYTVTIEDYQMIASFVEEFNENTSQPPLLIHTHLAEPSNELQQIIAFNEKHGNSIPDGVSSSTDFIHKIGLLSDRLLAAHCIHVSDKDLALFKKHNVRIALNPLSNSKLGNHMPPIPSMLKENLILGLGTDGASSNNTLSLLDTMRYLALYYKGAFNDPTIVNAHEVLKLATIGGAKVLDWVGIGTLEVGSLADVITIDLYKPHLSPQLKEETVLSHVVYAANGADVQNVIVDGKLLVNDRKFTMQISLDSVISNAQHSIERLLS
ncbi:MAG: amidohydrolase family protein [Candidatus Heimdallarchaeaceae archaeon]